ncbi:MAG: ATP-binding protein [Muribaculaceae bacterium]|jgi:signal transduction histidine kinase|nr:ATP-binding protein [Muribaculaceae bacterium]
MSNIYDIRRRGTVIFLIITAVVVAVFLWVSDSLVSDLAEQERARMQIWADATRQIVSADPFDADDHSDINFLLSIIAANRTIPVLVTDDRDSIIDQRNFNLPESADSLPPWVITPANEAYLRSKLARLKSGTNVIHISIAPGVEQHLYYEDSKLLQRLSLYPYVQLLVMLAFVAVVYYAVTSSKKAEQNKVWVGLSKETAHQLGTPISSLMAWIEMLPVYGVDQETVDEMNKDVQRLGTIASRFGKIGSPPAMVHADLNGVVRSATGYMSSRISSAVEFSVSLWSEPLTVSLSAPLLEWVMENLIKNAVDAMEGHGRLAVTTAVEGQSAVIEVADSGRGIPRKNFQTIFNPGFTTKSRGWGLGLTLAKRIVEQYHGGRIFVRSSEPGVGTVFCITLPILPAEKDSKRGL